MKHGCLQDLPAPPVSDGRQALSGTFQLVDVPNLYLFGVANGLGML